MDTNDRTSGRRLAQTVCSALAVAGGLVVLAAEPPAHIANRLFTVGGGKEVDAAVSVVAVDSRSVPGKQSSIELEPGPHEIEVLCTARVLAGMGTVDFTSKSVLTIRVESGRAYRLDAKATVQGDCTPVVE